MPAALALALALSPSMYAEPGQDLRLRCLNPGVRLVLYISSEGDPQMLGIQLLQGSNSIPKTVSSMADMRGYVTIRTAADALDFVRLRTSLATWDLSWAVDVEAEVTSATLSRRAANYGIKPDRPFPNSPGWLGVLPDRLLVRSRIAPAHVVKATDGFVVTRTLLTGDHGDDHLVTVEELVGADGAYRRRVLKTAPARLNGEFHWFFPLKE
ncbi:MAG TPA: hypothetical protein VKT78_00680 [Fimbriimonadaceae bacterium]|nr:hypothetical protein [Fimbriimonadaceae bacterium]